MPFATQPHGMEAYIHQFEGRSSMLREETYGQPWALAAGDMLANGLVLAENPREAGNGGVRLHLMDGTSRRVASQLPLLLSDGTSGKLAGALEVGDILQTGSVVLAPPIELDETDARFVKHSDETLITITGGQSGHEISVPSDVVIALHNESYPPAQRESGFGAFIVEKTLRMGARARRNLPNYGRLTEESEIERVTGVFNEIDLLREKAHQERDAYRNTLSALKEQCKALKGTELLITGRLQGRSGAVVYESDPKSQVENMHIEVSEASVYSYESHVRGVVAEHLPFITFQGNVVETGESIGAWIGVDRFGVSIEVITNDTPEV